MIYRFGVFEFDDGPAVLMRAGRAAALEPQPARALALLLARAGDLVSREELRAHLWGTDTHVDFDRGLAYCIGQLRTALGDVADNPRFVQTLPRRGFKFIAPVTVGAGDGAGRSDEEGGAGAAGASDGSGELGRSRASSIPARSVPARTMVAAAVAVLVVAAAGAGWWGLSRDRAPARPIVAVAVFDNESGDASHERAVAGLSDMVVERLTAVGPGRLGVIGNASVLRRPRADRDLKAIVQDTKASFLVSGQLQNRDGRLTLLMQLIRLNDGTHVWVQRLSRSAGASLDPVCQEAARQIEEAVRRIVLNEVQVVLIDPRAGR